ncbi:MAG: hypothetical protein PVH19_03250 [Planctomycetia bacterium]
MLTRRMVTDFEGQTDLLRAARYGVIEAVDGQFSRVVLRSWPKLISWPDVLVLGRLHHRRRSGNRCRLYFNQPRRFSSFLSIPYIVSSRGTTYRTVLAALAALDRIAKLKQSDALLCHVVNHALSDQMMERVGWERHCLNRFGRHFIKRFYGEYPV